ncbi:MAG: BrnT family toxin [Desulfamplus sp.]|nr:BrnT family toxin [Desulfamplus sp.]
MRFEWDPQKAEKNIEKHGISFGEAATVFSDPLSMTYDDPDHSYGENRHIIIGLSSFGELLFVSHLEGYDTIRIISARRLNRKERKRYEQQYIQ